MKKAPGILPSKAWLNANGYGGLAQCMQKNPRAFVHIEQNTRYRSPEEWVPVAEALASKHGGTLPCDTWLCKHGFIGLYWVLKKFPLLFANIRQDNKRGKTPQEWAAEAEMLAKKHGEILPDTYWLQSNGHMALYEAMRKYPRQFTHIQQKRKRLRCDEHVRIAENLARENGGTLPPRQQLKELGHENLLRAIRRYPQKFNHIQQSDCGTRTPQQWVPYAERLAKQHGGVLPNAKWLQQNRLSSLYNVIRRFPQLFAHIKQSCRRRQVGDWVPEADRLARENGGLLPNSKWLKKNGYNGLSQAKRNHPQLFTHIEQEKSFMTPEERVHEAERLANQNGGVLPNVAWLQGNGYSGLETYMRKHPHLFKHIKQKKRECLSPTGWVQEAERMVSENGGVLPNPTWLVQNGFSGLARAMSNNPNLFKHIKQKRLR